MGTRKGMDPLNTKDRIAKLRGFKRYLSKEVIADTWTAGDQAYLEFWTGEKLSLITKLEGMLETKIIENEDLRMNLKQTEDDYGQKIADLRTKLKEKCEEVAQMTEDNHRLILSRGTDLNHFEAALQAEEQKFVNTQERLTAEVKQLNSKLKNLEEFRNQRDGLIEEYQAQLQQLQTLEENAASIVIDYQRVDLINKDRMGQELKDRLLNLSIEFQEASQTETTKSLIRENVAINNELGGHIGSWQALHDQNQQLKKQRSLMRQDLRSQEALKEKCLALNVLQTQVLERLAYEHQKLDGFYDEIETLQRLSDKQRQKFEVLSREARLKEHEVNLLAQARHDLKTQVNELDHDYRRLLKVVQADEITLKKALLHVAEGQEMRLWRAEKRLPRDEINSKLGIIMKELQALFKDSIVRHMPSQSINTPESVSTQYDPDYATKYWKARGVIIGQPREARSQLERSPSENSSGDSS